MTPEELKIQEEAEQKYPSIQGYSVSDENQRIGEQYDAFILGAKSESAKAYHTKVMYSEEEVYVMLLKLKTSIPLHRLAQITPMELRNWFDDNKKK